MTQRSAGPGPNDPVVLFVDDEPGTLATYRFLFAHSPIQVVTARSGLHGLDLLSKRSDIALVVSDYWMAGMDGIAFLAEVNRRYPRLPRILLTGEPDSEIVLEAGVRVLTKGMDPALIRRVIVREAQRHG